jgi:hypothetical protein
MKKYEVIILESAFEDIDDLISFMLYSSNSQRIINNFRKGLFTEINKLSYLGSVFSSCRNKSIVDKYGCFAKRMNYKNVAVIFFILNEKVVVVSVKAQASITGI